MAGPRHDQPSADDAMSVDLKVVLVATASALVAALFPLTRGTVVAFVLGVTFVTFVPGYALIAALYPRADRDGSAGRMDVLTRLGLALPASLAIIPLAVGPLAWTRWGYRPSSVVGVLAAVTVVGVLIAHVRRRQRLPSERFHIPVHRWHHAVAGSGSGGTDRSAVILFLAVSVVVAVATVAVALAVPPTPDGTTQFYIGTSTADGDVVAGDYPRDFVVGEPETLVVGIENDQTESASYTVLVVLEVLDPSTAESTIIERDVLDRFETDELDPGTSWEHEHEVAPDRADGDFRLTYFLYEASPPPDPGPDTADDWVYLNIEVDG